MSTSEIDYYALYAKDQPAPEHYSTRPKRGAGRDELPDSVCERDTFRGVCDALRHDRRRRFVHL
jgi:hypothetical protein